MASKVWNNSDQQFVEDYNGEEIVIEPRSYVEMPYSKAHDFRGKYTTGSTNKYGQRITTKPLTVEDDPEEHAEKRDQPIRFTCEVTGKQFRTEKGYNQHLATLQQEPKGETNAKTNTRSRTTSRSKQ